MRRAQVFLAELLRGLEELGVRDPEIAKAMLRMLSLEQLEPPADAVSQGIQPIAAPRRAEKAPPLQFDVPASPSALPEPLLLQPREAKLRALTTAPARPAPPLWLAATEPLRRPSGPTPPSAHFQPLFPRTQARGLLGAALESWDDDGPPDVARAVEELAQLRALREMPRERAATLRLGAQVLIDVGIGMAPFLPDVDHVRDQIGRMLSAERAATHHFTGTPLRGCVATGVEEVRPWSAPVRGTPVLVITDLGIGGPKASEDRAGSAEWLVFFEAAASAGCPVTTLVPYGPRRWPRALVRAARIVHWDRRTSAAGVRSALARGARSSA